MSSKPISIKKTAGESIFLLSNEDPNPLFKPEQRVLDIFNSSISEELNLSKLPKDMLGEIINNLSLKDIAAFSKICKTISNIIKNNSYIWLEQYKKILDKARKFLDENSFIELSPAKLDAHIAKTAIKTIKEKIKQIKKTDIISIFKEIEKMAQSEGKTLTYPNFDELEKKSFHEVKLIFNEWIENNKTNEIYALDLSSKNLHYIPKALCNLRITLLKLQNNCLTSLPKNFGNFPSLERLILNDNNLEELPESFENLKPNLETLFIQNNEFKKCPNSLIKIREGKKLEVLKLDGNPMPVDEIKKYNKER